MKIHKKLFNVDFSDKAKIGFRVPFDEWIQNKIELRNKARTTKDYILSDKIRDELLDVGIDLKDNPDGSTNWSVKI